MKKFIEVTAAVKSVGAMVFAGLIIVYTVFGGFFGLREMSFSLVWQALFIASIAAVLHYLTLSEAHLTKQKFALRIALFAVPMLAVLSGFAIVFHWFPADNPWSWLVFVAVYLFFFGVVTLVFHLYTVVTGKRYTEMLDAYKQRHSA